VSAASAFNASVEIEQGVLDRFLPQILIAIKDRQRVLEDHTKQPPKTQEMLASGHQVWVWMQGPGKPHWEVRGPGVTP
jgi:hypothetical protein